MIFGFFFFPSYFYFLIQSQQINWLYRQAVLVGLSSFLAFSFTPNLNVYSQFIGEGRGTRI